MNKKGIELSINFLVVLILALAIFTFGVIFVYKILASSESLKSMTLEDIDSRIADLNCAGNDASCIDKERFLLAKEDIEIVTVKVLNIDRTYKAKYSIKAAPNVRYDLQGQPQGGFSTADVMVMPDAPGYQDIEVEPNKEEKVGFAFQVKGTVYEGTYVFNLIIEKQIWNGVGWDPPVTETHKIWIEIS